MKKFFLVIPAFVGAIFFHPVSPQPCTMGNPGVKLNYSLAGSGGCSIGIDLYFDLKHNPGGKWFWVHIWPTASYSNWNYGSPPTTGNGGLTGSIATFGVEHQGTSLVIQPSYPPDPSAPGFQYSGLVVAEGPGTMPGSERYTIKNLQLTISVGCDIPQSFTADLWESQSAQSQNVHCFVKGMSFYANDPGVSGSLYCDVPHRYAFDIQTISTNDMLVNYKVYVDNGDGTFNVNTDTLLIRSGSTVLDATNQYKYNSGILDYLPYSDQKPYADRDLWVEVTTASVPNAIYAQLVNQCFSLPVRLHSFTATRNMEMVELKWATASEFNNRGFFVERMNGTSNWETIAFVPSQAAGGNSNFLLDYHIKDQNVSKGISQYRLRQVDIDNKTSYSEVRLVKGLSEIKNLVVYPNPCRGKEITFVTDFNTNELTIQLIDMNGRIVKEWNNPSTNKLYIDSITAPGIYMLQIWNRYTRERGQAKIIISR